ncbi:GNAT family N-acetyltransferase [Actinosynnema sp.]|uniref:GNAT family N-acetyltransferase n=1 Tax=Actinosynnema sp. TaxID=1872144 RepID=UPI003F84BB63
MEEFATVLDVPSDDWDRVVPDDAFYDCHAWLAAVEQDRTARPSYWVARSRGCVVGAAVTYRVHLEGLPMADPAKNPATRDIGRNLLLAGSRRGYRTRLLTDRSLTDRDRADVIGALLAAARLRASEHGLDGVGFMYLNGDDARMLDEQFDARTVELDQQAQLDLPLGGWEDWLQSLSRRTRYTVRSEGRAFEAAGLTCALEEFDDQSIPIVANLAAGTEARHGHQSTPASIERVLRHQYKAAGDLARLFVTRDSQNEPVACSLHFEWRGVLFARLYGADPARTAGVGEYFTTLFYAPISHALKTGLRALHLGTGSLRAKELRGARLEASYAAVLLKSERSREALPVDE